jgi:hypothetical protein
MRTKRRFCAKGLSPSNPDFQKAVRHTSLIETLEHRLLLTTVPYTFQNVNIGAGGFVDGIYYDPKNQNVLYAHTDIGGLYKSTNDATTWTQLLDFVGNNTSGSQNGTQAQEMGVLSFAIDPENSNNLYADVGEYSGTNGAVFYSTSSGQSWGIDNLSFSVGGNSDGRGDGDQLAVDPNNSNIIFLGTNANGLWESTNAGQSFSLVPSFSPTSTTFVLFNSAGGVSGGATQNIFVGIDSTSSGTNLYETTTGGTSWSQVAGTGSLPTGYLPGHAVISGGYMYLGYANATAPNIGTIGLLSDGGLYRLQLSTGNWTDISPLATDGSFGYDGVTADPNNPNIVVAASFDYYSGPDEMWLTVDAQDPSPKWTDELYDSSTAQNYGYDGYDNTRNTTDAPWVAPFGDGVGNWVATIAIDPFNSNQLMYGTGEGIWATNNLSNNGTYTQLDEANSWYFPNTGIEFTDIDAVAAPTAGTPLYSAMNDIGGFANTSLMFSPTQGSIGPGSTDATDYAGLDPNDAVMVGSSVGNTNGVYTTDGTNFTAFAANPNPSAEYDGSGDSVAISANGSTIVWAPSWETAYYSTNDGSSWNTATLTGGSALPTGGTIVSDKVNPNYFYYWTENTDDNSWTLFISSNGGVSFTQSAGGSIPTGNTTLVVNPNVAGQLWLGTYDGIYESTNFGASFSHPFSYSTNVSSIALGARAPGSSYPAIYIYGTPAGDSFEGIYRSDDGGNTWLQLNTTNQQWGGLIAGLAADPNVFGRVYIGVNGRGIIMGNPTSSLPAGWTDTDINEPGNPGWATNSTTLSTGAVVNQWTINGGGAGIAPTTISLSSLTVSGDVATAVTSAASGFQVGQTISINGASNPLYDGNFVITGLANNNPDIGAATAFTFNISEPNATVAGSITATLQDQFNFAYEPITGNSVTVSAQLTSLTNADTGDVTPEAGIMIRNGTSPISPFVALFQTASGSLVFEDRSNGALQTQTVTGIPVGSEYLKIVGNNDSFTGYFSSTGSTWTQIGVSVTVPTTGSLNVGLAATANFNPQLTSATFTNVVVASAFATQSGSTLDINLNTGGPVTIAGSGNTITATQNGSQDSFTGITSIVVTDSGSGDTLNFNGGITAPLTFAGAAASTINVNSGTLNFAAASTISLGALNISSGALAAVPVDSSTQTRLLLSSLSIASGKLDLNDNEMFITYASGSDPISTIYGYIKSGFNNGNWNGPGIISTAAQTPTNGLKYALGFADGKDRVVAGLASGQIEIKYTLLGDANLDGTVNGSDFSILAGNFGLGFTNWDQGNFLFTSSVNGSDFSALSANFGQGITLPAVAAIVEAPASPVATTITTTTASTTDATTPTDRILKSNPKTKHRVLH